MSGNAHAESATLTELRSDVTEAASLTSDPIWRSSEFVPFVGHNLNVIRVVVEAADQTVETVLTPLIEASAGSSLKFSKLTDGTADLDALAKLHPLIVRSAEQTSSILATLNAVDTAGTIEPVQSAVVSFRTQLGDFSTQLNTALNFLSESPAAFG